LHSYLPNTCILIYRNPAFLFAEYLHCYLPFTTICSGVRFGTEKACKSKSGIRSKVYFIFCMALFDFRFNRNREIAFIGRQR